eukprot:Lankesteria_metandrocarpae@DN8900_c0_g1_i1.p1
MFLPEDPIVPLVMFVFMVATFMFGIEMFLAIVNWKSLVNVVAGVFCSVRSRCRSVILVVYMTCVFVLLGKLVWSQPAWVVHDMNSLWSMRLRHLYPYDEVSLTWVVLTCMIVVLIMAGGLSQWWMARSLKEQLVVEHRRALASDDRLDRLFGHVERLGQPHI